MTYFRRGFLLISVAVATGLVSAAGLAGPSTTRIARRAVIGPVVPFIEDDYSQALARARVRKIPIFIEAWAPW